MSKAYDDATKKLRYISLFSGIEAASVAWEPLGWEPVAFSEIDKLPCALLAKRFPGVPNLGDITTIDWNKYAGTVDVVVGGSPCQSFSIAGKREGLSGESGLMFEYIRAVSELRPRYFVWENVPGALSSEGGAAFGQLLSEMDDIGYGLAWRVLDSQFAGVAQRRRRVFLVGCLGDPERAAEILFERDSLRWDHPSSRDKRKELTGASKLDLDGSRVSITQNTLAFDTTQITSPTNGNNPQFGDPCHPLCASAHVPAVAYTQYGENIAGTLTARYDSSPCVDRGQNILCVASDHAGAETCENMAPTLTAHCGKGSVWINEGAVVRRLTPTECERLQGFPDGWTDLGDTPDAPRYKALGNSMAVPVMRWIGERIAAVDAARDRRLHE